MKTLNYLFKPVMLFFFLGLTYSCSNENVEQVKVNPSEFVLKSDLNLTNFSRLSKKIDNQFRRTKSVDNLLTEEEAKILLDPVLKDGEKIKKDILNSIDSNTPEYQMYSELTDKELILLSVISVANNPTAKAKSHPSLTGKEVLDCILGAIGIAEAIPNLRISGLVTAKTGLQILKAVARRYALGYIALAYSIYNFVDSINDHRKD